MSYQRKQLSTDTNVGTPGPLPPELVGLADSSLADIEAAVGHDAADQLGYLDTGFFPEAVPAPPPGSVTATQFKVVAHQAGQYDDINTQASLTGGEVEIRWQNQVVFAPTDVWLHDLCIDAGLTEDEYQALFAAGAGTQDTSTSAF
jgi:hypothetical protein